MAVNQVIHPAADVLRAFALGKLDDTTSEVVMTHLDSCPECCKQVAALSGDDFIARLRQAHGLSKTPAPPKSLVEVAQAPKPPANQPPIANLPPELANNPQYQVLRELGRGGMGVVYLAKNKLMDRLEVLKVVNGTLLDHPGAVERFLREIRSAAKLNHANVVTAYSAVQNGQLLAFAMEYVEGQDLGTLVKSQGPLPVPHACFYVQQAAYGLQHAFEKQMVHRDIKPQNLILAREGKKHVVKVLDFGLAKVMREKSEDTGLTGEGQMLGTPDYIAPEQSLDAAKADIRADIYSLGCTLYYLLSGAAPFSANSLAGILLAHQLDEAKPLNLVRPEVPKELAAVVRKMMAKSPDKRYQTPLEVVQALNPFVKQAALPKTSPELSTGTPKAAGVKPVKPVKPERPQVPVAQAKERPPLPGAPPPVGWDKLTESSVPAARAAQEWGDPQSPAAHAAGVAAEQVAACRQLGRPVVGRRGRHVGRWRVQVDDTGRHPCRRCQRVQARRVCGRRQDDCRLGEGRQACRDPRQAGDAQSGAEEGRVHGVRRGGGTPGRQTPHPDGEARQSGSASAAEEGQSAEPREGHGGIGPGRGREAQDGAYPGQGQDILDGLAEGRAGSRR